MRLIDADKLLEDLKQKRYSKRSLELIQSQPEIEAIPINWLIEHAIDYGISFSMRNLIDDWKGHGQ